MPRNTIIQVAIAEIGTKESPPKSNKTKYGAWYGHDGYPWCALFVSWVYRQAGNPLGKIDDDNGYRGCQSAFNYWKTTGEITTAPQPADIVLYDWNGDGKCDHTGIFQEWVIPGETFHAIEGNTAVNDDSNGGEVMLRIRTIQNVRAFVSPKILGGIAVPVNENVEIGDKGSKVADIQRLLHELGYIVVVDGEFGNQTEKAVFQFQGDYKFITDGVVTPALEGFMDEQVVRKTITISSLINGSYLELGATGSAVATLQNELNKVFPASALSVDGVFGNGTLALVKKVQADNKLVVDGVAGPKTFAALNLTII